MPTHTALVRFSTLSEPWARPLTLWPLPFVFGVYSTMLKIESKLAHAISRDPFVPKQRLRRITIKLHLRVSSFNFLFQVQY